MRGIATITATTPADRLPRAGALTDAILGQKVSATGREPVGEAEARAVAEGLTRRLSALGDRRPVAPGLLRIGHFQVACVLSGHAERAVPSDVGRSGAQRPFRWTARAARRQIGLAALRTGLDGRSATPADAVALVMAEPGGPAGVGRAGPGSCADWISTLPRPARVLVTAEAVAWTTKLWTALDWGRLHPRHLVVGGPDRWWRWTGAGPGAGPGAGASPDPGALRLAVRGRADIRLGPARGSHGAHRGTHLLVLDGSPGAGTRHALLLSALVDALSSPRAARVQPVPGCVVGWWPDCGKAWVVEVDPGTLTTAADALVETVAALLRSTAQGGWARAH